MTTHTHTTEGILTQAQEQFLSYVYTSQILQLRFRGVDEIQGTPIPQKEIEQRFFIYPKHNRKREIKYLVDHGYLKHWQEPTTNGHKKDMYLALRACGLSPHLILHEKPELGPTSKYMLHCLLRTTLTANSPSTPYFDFFLKYGTDFPFLFFKFDDFSRRLHTAVTSLPGKIRKNLLIEGQPTASIDVSQMQPQLLANVLQTQIGDNQFTQWMNSGLDIYEIMATNAYLPSRQAGKEKFFELTFGFPNPELELLFGKQKWVSWINWYKGIDEPAKPEKYRNKNHNNLAFLLSRTEVQLMRQIWAKLATKNIPFLTVHDEVIVHAARLQEAEKIFHEVLRPVFKKYELHY